MMKGMTVSSVSTGLISLLLIMGKKWYSHKFKHSELHYEVALSIKTGCIYWVSGLWNPGKWNNLEIFCKILVTFLEQFERVEAYDGYIG